MTMDAYAGMTGAINAFGVILSIESRIWDAILSNEDDAFRVAMRDVHSLRRILDNGDNAEYDMDECDVNDAIEYVDALILDAMRAYATS